MSKRYYLCAIIGDGSAESPFRAAVSDHNVNHVAAFPPQDPATGVYTRNVCLALVNTINHLPLLADAALDAFPDVAMDIKVNAIHRLTMQRFEDRVRARGLSTDAFASADGYREVLRDLGRQLDSNFDENNFDVSI